MHKQEYRSRGYILRWKRYEKIRNTSSNKDLKKWQTPKPNRPQGKLGTGPQKRQEPASQTDRQKEIGGKEREDKMNGKEEETKRQGEQKKTRGQKWYMHTKSVEHTSRLSCSRLVSSRALPPPATFTSARSCCLTAVAVTPLRGAVLSFCLLQQPAV